MGFLSESKRVIRNRFLSGLLVIVPLILTFVLLRGLVVWIDGWMRPVVVRILGHPFDFPFVGIAITFALIMLAGILTANVFGNRLIRLWELLLLQIPLVSFVYGSAKQFIQALAVPHKKAFKSVVLVEYPRRGCYAIGFLSNQTTVVRDGIARNYVCVFIPSTPTPFTGMPIFFPEEEVVHLKMPIEDGIKLAVSGGIITPPALEQDQARRAELPGGKADRPDKSFIA